MSFMKWSVAVLKLFWAFEILEFILQAVAKIVWENSERGGVEDNQSYWLIFFLTQQG